MKPVIWATRLAATTVIIILFVLIMTLGSATSVTLLVGLLGVVGGATVGILFSPWGPDDKKEFQVYRGAIAAFLGGYVLGKADSILGYIGKGTVLDPLMVKRYLVFATAFLLAAVCVFASRRYFNE